MNVSKHPNINHNLRDMTYKDCFIEALSNTDLIKQYDRLNNTSLHDCLTAMSKGGINHEIDKTTGRLKSEIEKFEPFFYDLIWIPMTETD